MPVSISVKKKYNVSPIISKVYAADLNEQVIDIIDKLLLYTLQT